MGVEEVKVEVAGKERIRATLDWTSYFAPLTRSYFGW
jgi:hypothetical protein